LVSETQRKLWDYSKKTIKKPLFFHFIHGKTRAIWDEYITLLVQCWYQFGIKTPFFSFLEGFLRSKTLDTSDFLPEGQTCHGANPFSLISMAEIG